MDKRGRDLAPLFFVFLILLLFHFSNKYQNRTKNQYNKKQYPPIQLTQKTDLNPSRCLRVMKNY